MSYYFSTPVKGDFHDNVNTTIQLLHKEWFGVLTQIDIQQTFKKKLNVDFNRYKILGVCNPQFAHKALVIKNKVGTRLPCNVIVQAVEPNTIEVAVVNPIASMQAIKNPNLAAFANEVSEKLKKVIKYLKNEK